MSATALTLKTASMVLAVSAAPLSLSLAFPTFFPAFLPEVEVCDGCGDVSDDPTVTDNSPYGGMDSTVTQMDGACFIVPSTDDCRQEYPCTPYVVVTVAGGPYAHATGTGSIGGTGLGASRQTWTEEDAWQDKTLYEDYSQVSCGHSKEFWYQATWNTGTTTATSTLECNPCCADGIPVPTPIEW